MAQFAIHLSRSSARVQGQKVNLPIRAKFGRGSYKTTNDSGMAGSIPVIAHLSQELDELTWSEVTILGVQLGMKFSVLQKIGETKADSVRLLAAMDAWLQSDPKASWKKVVRALMAIRKEVLAQELEEKYCRDGGSEICVTAENDGSSAATVAEEALSGSSTQPLACETTTHHLPSNNPPAPQGVCD